MKKIIVAAALILTTALLLSQPTVSNTKQTVVSVPHLLLAPLSKDLGGAD